MSAPKRLKYRPVVIDGIKAPVWTVGGRETVPPVGMPTELIIKGRKFQVRYHTKIWFARKKSEQLAGVILYEIGTIVIDPDALPRGLRQTLFHEIAHAYLRGVGLSAEAEEKVADTFGWALLDLVANNRDLLISCLSERLG